MASFLFKQDIAIIPHPLPPRLNHEGDLIVPRGSHCYILPVASEAKKAQKYRFQMVVFNLVGSAIM